ncbi:MAG: glycosyltransferase family 1 protein [Verrucomicrobiota bacterium]|nr:glycosyltransferase family 1 protein [Verrucomicrobiota bacterium]
MRIFVDAQPLAAPPTGVGRYTFEVVAALAQRLSPQTDRIDLGYFDFRRNAGPFLQDLIHLGPPIFPHPSRILPGRLAQAAWKYFGAPPHAAFFPSSKADLLFFPNFVIPPTRHPVKVCTVHDLSFVRFPQFAEDRNLQWLEKAVPRSIERAAAILTDSEFSRREILDVYQPPADRVFAVPLACSDIFRPAPRSEVDRWRTEQGLPNRYFLSVGTLEPRKNIQVLLEAFQVGCECHAWPDDVALVLTGMHGWKTNALYQQIETHPFRARIVETGYLPWNELPLLYSGATAFLIPSHYEGFGMPLLEAMACGVPCISSPAASLPEVGGVAVLYAATDAPQAWTEAMALLTHSPGKREKYSHLGLQRAKEFSWAVAAEKILEIFRSLL